MSTRQSVSSIAIIGSGIGGVAAAVALRQAGLDAVLYHALSNISERSDPLMSKSFQYLAGAAFISFCLWLYSSSIVSASGAENYATQANGDVGSLYNKK